MTVIDSFIGEYAFLSNFYPSEFQTCIYNDYEDCEHIFKTNEHYYQASKAADLRDAVPIIKSSTAGEAKKLGRKVEIRENWEEIKYDVMLTGLREKFANLELTKLLLDTDRIPLIEGNHWGDKIWGMTWETIATESYGDIDRKYEGWVGDNWLGRLLELVREEKRAWWNANN